MQRVKKNGKTRYRVQYRKPDGSRASAWFGCREDAREFEERLGRTRERMNEGLKAPTEKILVMDAMPEWLRTRRVLVDKGLLAYSAWVGDESKARRTWVPEIGNYPLSSVGKADIIRILNAVLEGRAGIDAAFKESDLKARRGRRPRPGSPAYRNRHLAMVHKFFEDQIDLNRLEQNPAARIPKLSEKQKTRRLVALDVGQAESYLRAAKPSCEQYWRLANLMIGGGARVSEAIALTVGDYDAKTSTLTIRRILEIVSGEIVERTKGEGSGGEHHLPVFPALGKLLDQWTRGRRPDEFIVTGPEGRGSMSYWYAERLHHEVRAAAGDLPRLTIHDLRRTCARLLAQAGMTTREVQGVLGHASIQTTEGSYLKGDARLLAQRGRELGLDGANVVPFRPTRKEARRA